MALLSEAVFNRLTTYSGLSALIGTRAYPLRLPQQPTAAAAAAALPAVTYRVVSAERFSAMGYVDKPDVGTRLQVDVWSDTAYHATRGMKQVAKQVRAALTRWNGTYAGVVILDTYFEVEVEYYEPEVDATHRVAIDFRVFYEE